jgi:hypothetical protein
MDVSEENREASRSVAETLARALALLEEEERSKRREREEK